MTELSGFLVLLKCSRHYMTMTSKRMRRSPLLIGRTKRGPVSRRPCLGRVYGLAFSHRSSREFQSALPFNYVPLTWTNCRYARKDLKGAILGEELSRIGFKGDVPASFDSNKLSAHFEVHIEQGPILEAENKPIGVVTGVQGETCR